MLLDTDPAPPDRQEPAKPVDQDLPPTRRERRGGAAEEPCARLDGQGVGDEERVKPAPMGGGDEDLEKPDLLKEQEQRAPIIPGKN